MFFEECPKRRVSLGVLNPLQINGNKKNTIDVRTLGGSDVNGVFIWWRRGELNPRSPSSPSFSPVPSGLAPQWIAVFRVFSSSCLVRPIPFSLVTFYLPEYLPTNRKAYVELPVTNFPYMFPVLFFECSNRHLENSVRLSIGRVGHTTQ